MKYAVILPDGTVASEHKTIRVARKNAEYQATILSDFGRIRKFQWITIVINRRKFGGEVVKEPYEKITRAGRRFHVERLWTKR